MILSLFCLVKKLGIFIVERKDEMNAETLWREILELLKKMYPGVIINTVFNELEPYAIHHGQLILIAPSAFIIKMIQDRFLKDMQLALDQISRESLVIQIEDSQGELPNIDLVSDGTGGQRMIPIDQEREEIPEAIVPRRKNYNQDLIPKYTFDTFVRGQSNELALSAAMNVAENPSKQYNPLFIWGRSGLGKTHLIQAIAHYILEHDPSKQVAYVTSETFTNELIEAIRDRDSTRNQQFREKYRNVDVLIIDDIQFIAGKKGTQDEFFHTFNQLYNQNKQIILTSDRPPEEIETLQERLTSRFQWGLMADIGMPDYETRVAIIQAKLEEENDHVPREVQEYIAHNIKSNIRTLEGALMRIIAYKKSLRADEITLDMARTALASMITDSEKKPITIDLILEITAEYYDIDMEGLKSKSRERKFSLPRQIAMYLSRKLTDLSLVNIGNAFSRDHSTISHGVEKIEEALNQDSQIRQGVDELITRIEEA